MSGISTLTSVHATGADPDAFKNDNGNTAIIMACSLGKADVVARLLQGGAELNQRTKVLTHWSIKLLQRVSHVNYIDFSFVLPFSSFSYQDSVLAVHRISFCTCFSLIPALTFSVFSLHCAITDGVYRADQQCRDPLDVCRFARPFCCSRRAA